MPSRMPEKFDIVRRQNHIVRSVYFFNEGDGKNKRLFGGKGAGLMEMTKLGLPVPPGFTITTEVCNRYFSNKCRLPEATMYEVSRNISKIERRTGRKFGSEKLPLLVSVRSGAAVSMPGMMDTILNLGLNDKTVKGLANSSNNPRFAWDSYLRFVQLFGKIVFNIEDKEFEAILTSIKQDHGLTDDSEMSERLLREAVTKYKGICQRHTNRQFPDDPYKQLQLAIEAVFKSWIGRRAVAYREKYNITKDVASGTAVNVVAMVFGNMGTDSATGVVFTRDPTNGSKKIFGEYLVNAQGEDVVAGIRTPQQIDKLAMEMPVTFKRLLRSCKRLEKHYKEPQDIEFTIERGKLYILQTRSAKMNATAMIRTSIDMVNERMITRKQSIMRIQAEDLDQILHRTIDASYTTGIKPVASGIPASPGAASGQVIFDVNRAISDSKKGNQVILVREETKPEDVPAFFSSAGILTSKGGKTSHAAVVARGMGRPCIVGCAKIIIDYSTKKFSVNGRTVNEGDIITIDGTSGNVYEGSMPTLPPKLTDDVRKILDWAGDFKTLEIRANADTQESARLARTYGASGIGLCRTERMFNAHGRLATFVDLIMAETDDSRRATLQKLGVLQKQDFKEILEIMGGCSVTIRLLDPPLHEFLPSLESSIYKVSGLEKGGDTPAMRDAQRVLQRVRELVEVNPMMGHRGVRIGITHPEIYEMQIRAVCEAAAELESEKIKVHPQIMVPQVGCKKELDYIKKIYESVKSEVESRTGIKLKISFGTMMEVVRACLTADEIAGAVDFFSFGTNDLTQAVFSFSREDAEGKFLPQYIEKEILAENPFQSLDTKGVGSLIGLATSKGRSVKTALEIGICGEHGGDPKSIKFFHKTGLTYVSASPHRIPIAILAAAQAAIEHGQPKKRARMLA